VFEVKLLCEDKKLAELMWALDGIAAEPPQILPVRGATVKRTASGLNKVTSQYEPAEGTLAHRVEIMIRNAHLSTLPTDVLTQMVKDAGGAQGSTAYVGRSLQKMGLLSRQGNGQYLVNAA
jgi:hypothetical protein